MDMRLYVRYQILQKYEILHEICSFDFQENHLICWHQMSDFKAKTHQNPILAGAPPQTPLVRGGKRKWGGKELETEGKRWPALQPWWPGNDLAALRG